MWIVCDSVLKSKFNEKNKRRREEINRDGRNKRRTEKKCKRHLKRSRQTEHISDKRNRRQCVRISFLNPLLSLIPFWRNYTDCMSSKVPRTCVFQPTVIYVTYLNSFYVNQPEFVLHKLSSFPSSLGFLYERSCFSFQTHFFILNKLSFLNFVFFFSTHLDARLIFSTNN
jgi:hypothetical protein